MYTHTHVGLIDFGQVKRLTRAQRLQLCMLIIALDNHDQDQVLELFVEMGCCTQEDGQEGDSDL
jgi:predicted unusual protein kinase regulating ubiquinone biosynthesis (AarF/ABC1/UbiB family)